MDELSRSGAPDEQEERASERTTKGRDQGATIVFANLDGKREEFHIADLLPRAFDARFLKNK